MGTALAFFVMAAAVAAIAYPLWKPAPAPPPDPSGPAARRRDREEQKERIYAAIRELGFDYRSDKLVEADYREEVEQLKSEAVSVVRELEELRGSPPRGPDDLEEEIANLRRQLAKAGPAEDATFCTQCGQRGEAGHRFCATCGNRLGSQAQ